MRQNILKTFSTAPVEYIDKGLNWYMHVNQLASDMGDVGIASGVIAALSPNTPWDRNLVLASKAMAIGHCDGGTFGNSVRNANRIIAGEDPAIVLGSKKGFKTLNFYRNIVNPLDNQSVTIDRHAYDIAVNKRHGSDYRPIGTSLKAYESYAQAYRDGASVLGMLPNQLQAITWEWYRANLTNKRGTK